jgi:hypothetical protein
MSTPIVRLAMARTKTKFRPAGRVTFRHAIRAIVSCSWKGQASLSYTTSAYKNLAVTPSLDLGDQPSPQALT